MSPSTMLVVELAWRRYEIRHDQFFFTPSVHRCPSCEAFCLRRRPRSVNYSGVQDWSDGVPTMIWRQEPLVRCHACAALFWLDDIEPVVIIPKMPRSIGRFTRMAAMRGDPQGVRQDEEEWPKPWRYEDKHSTATAPVLTTVCTYWRDLKE